MSYAQEPSIGVIGKGKSKLDALLLCFFLGAFGAHRFYLGYTTFGILQLLTVGGCGLWTLIDFILIATGKLNDSQGNTLTNRTLKESKISRILILSFIGLCILVIVVTSLIIETPKSSTDPVVSNVQTNTIPLASPETSIDQTMGIPPAKYKIISVDVNETVSKCNVHVQLDSEITEDQIKVIGNEIRESRTDYKRLYIFYYLPKMKVGSGCWATSHFLPDMTVVFTGFLPPK